jgi:hypothetical protein
MACTRNQFIMSFCGFAVMAHPDGVGKGTEAAVGFGSVQGAEVGVALAVGFEEVRFDEEIDPPLPGGVGFAVRLAGDLLDSV